MKHDMEKIREALHRMHDHAVNNGPPYMRIPADPTEDADLILSAAIDELEALRARAAELAVATSPVPGLADSGPYTLADVEAIEQHRGKPYARLRETVRGVELNAILITELRARCDAYEDGASAALGRARRAEARVTELVEECACWERVLDADRAAWAEARKALEQQVAAAKADAARAELRARELTEAAELAHETLLMEAASFRSPNGEYEYSARTMAALSALDEAKGSNPNSDERLREALDQINAIRNSIVGAQGVNWSEHIYPLVAALDGAGFEGVAFEEARANVGTLIERVETLEQQLVAATNDAARAELRAREMEEVIRACESPHQCPACDAKLGPQTHRDDCLLARWHLAAAPDSDARLREVMLMVAKHVENRDRFRGVEKVSVPIEFVLEQLVDEVLGRLP